MFDAPLENVITTGVTAEAVESMERALKSDLLREAEMNGGKILLHDEVAESDGSFTIIAAWEEVGESEYVIFTIQFFSAHEKIFDFDDRLTHHSLNLL